MKTKARAQFMRFLRHNWVTEKFLLAEDFFGHLLEIHDKMHALQRELGRKGRHFTPYNLGS